MAATVMKIENPEMVAIAVAAVATLVLALVATVPGKMTTPVAVTRTVMLFEVQFLAQVCRQLLQRSWRTGLPSSLAQAEM
jgi:hypothetical protein